MLERGIEYPDGSIVIQLAQFGDTLNTDLDWVWQDQTLIFERRSNIVVGMLNEAKHYISYYKPYDLTFGWIVYHTTFDDFYVKEVIITEYGERQIK